MAMTNNACDQPNQPQTFNSAQSLDHISFNGVVAQGYQKVILANGGTATIANNKYIILILPATLLGTGTIIMPTAPNDGQIIRISSTQIITLFSLQASPGQTLSGAPGSLGINVGYSFIFTADNTTWYRLY